MLRMAGVAGAVLFTGLPGTVLAGKARSGVAKPIPQTFFFPGPVDGSAADTDPTGAHPDGRDPSTVYDFNGFIGQCDLKLSGTGTDTTTGDTAPYTFGTDMRFMKGVFVDTAGSTQRGAFVFI